MAFIDSRKTRNSLNYDLVEGYRDEAGRSRNRTLCHLGTEADSVNTLEKAPAHWQRRRE